MYRKANWTCWTIAILNQVCGFNIFIFYSNSLFNGFDITSEQITAIFAIINIISVIIAAFSLHYFGRKTLLLCGFIGMAICLTLIGAGLYLKMDYVVISMVMLNVMCFAMSSGPITYLYMAEVMDDKGLSIGTFILQGFTVGISAIVLPIKNAIGDDNIGAIFLFCGVINTLGSLFLFFFLKETKGLTQFEINNL